MQFMEYLQGISDANMTGITGTHSHSVLLALLHKCDESANKSILNIDKYLNLENYWMLK